jgi:aspartyl-tRNA(Asn)/glutamyl-tRNA(Gln) amidotransferase subunit A
MNDLATISIREVAALIAKRSLSSVEVTRTLLERIDQWDSRLRTFITVDAEGALAQAQRADAVLAAGDPVGPLHGVPLGIKDNIAVADLPTTNGSHVMAQHVTDYDATVVVKLRQAGAVILGKTNMHEWGWGGTSVYTGFGSVRNPWDTDRIAGGSSGGSSAAVSASLVYGALGTDGMGSIRMPAAYCGVVGLKPTGGLVSGFGSLPPGSGSIQAIGPLAKDVADAALMLDAIAGHDPNDPLSIAAPRSGERTPLEAGVRGLRIGVPDALLRDATREVQGLVQAALDTLAGLGANVHKVEIPSLRYVPLMTTPMLEGDGGAQSFLRRKLIPLGPSAFADPFIRDAALVGTLVRTADTLKAARLRNLIRKEFLGVMDEVDVLAGPTTVSAAFRIDQDAPDDADVGPDGSLSVTIAATTSLTFPFNIVGMPAVSVPCGSTGTGLPVGLHIAGRHWEDDVVLRAAYAYEQAATGGYTMPPMMDHQPSLSE